MPNGLDNYTVYMHVSPSNKVYIGITRQTLKKRFMNGQGYKGCPKFYNAILKYGWDNFKHIILFEGLTKEQAEQKEIKLIQKYKSNNKAYGYNVENGGNCCGTHSEETKQKISAGNKGKIYSAESIAKMKEAHKGKQTGSDNPFYGKKHKEESLRMMSEAHKGNTSFKGHHHSEEFRKMKSKQMKEKYGNGNNPRCKKVVCITGNGEVRHYNSLRSAAKEMKISVSAMFNMIHSDNPIDGAVWRYVT